MTRSELALEERRDRLLAIDPHAEQTGVAEHQDPHRVGVGFVRPVAIAEAAVVELDQLAAVLGMDETAAKTPAEDDPELSVLQVDPARRAALDRSECVGVDGLVTRVDHLRNRECEGVQGERQAQHGDRTARPRGTHERRDGELRGQAGSAEQGGRENGSRGVRNRGVPEGVHEQIERRRERSQGAQPVGLRARQKEAGDGARAQYEDVRTGMVLLGEPRENRQREHECETHDSPRILPRPPRSEALNEASRAPRWLVRSWLRRESAPRVRIRGPTSTRTGRARGRRPSGTSPALRVRR